jgi:Domain of unknown function (DUF4386)
MTIHTAELSQATAQMVKSTNKTSPGRAALIAGIGLLVMAIAAPFAELYVYPKLIVPGNAAETVQNIMANRVLFTAGMFGYLIAFLCDVLVAWALYLLLKPVNENLSLLTAWFRLVYTVIALIALLNLVTVLRLVNPSNPSAIAQPDLLQAQVMFSIQAFKSHWYFGLLFFGIHLGLLGYLVFVSKYIPRILGVLLVIAGVGYMLTTLKPYVFPGLNLDFAEYTFYGELIFMVWLLVRGPRIKESNEEVSK